MYVDYLTCLDDCSPGRWLCPSSSVLPAPLVLLFFFFFLLRPVSSVPYFVPPSSLRSLPSPLSLLPALLASSAFPSGRGTAYSGTWFTLQSFPLPRRWLFEPDPIPQILRSGCPRSLQPKKRTAIVFHSRNETERGSPCSHPYPRRPPISLATYRSLVPYAVIPVNAPG
ncbi:hypothetical protein BZA05DRAFT_62679 [Tricharina praecox]|uniref:uncharacterized protein n=1 Tax=Tricharina praecox TaxID=43433 RepID=UPI00221F81DF|nr:uncharacterized protein BZA05DRAFT_62679 [Tricharina praecox]KAI5850750.1 hypothetical protein BZA05DRAFT_62679 [Tricharina praecox]